MDKQALLHLAIKRTLVVLTVCSFSSAFLTAHLVINHHLDWASLTSVLTLFFLLSLWIVTYKSNRMREKLLKSLDKKNTYLEHAAKILRHDMHSGINMYIPRGISSLERRLSEEDIKKLKIGAPLKMLRDGLTHTQTVYKGVYEFTNLVKKDAVLEKELLSLKEILNDYLKTTSYKSQVQLMDNLPTIKVNGSLFCTAVDNLIRNGLKYNDSDNKLVKIYKDKNYICIEDNGRGMSQQDYKNLSKPYVRKKEQKEQGSGLGLNISTSILNEHGFRVSVEKLEGGKHEFEEDLKRYEETYKDRGDVVFDRKKLEKNAKDNKYMGKLLLIRGGRNKSKHYLIYKEGKSKESILTKGTKIKIKYR